MAQAQLAGYDTWIGKSQRFGLTHWPLVGIGDGGDVSTTSTCRTPSEIGPTTIFQGCF